MRVIVTGSRDWPWPEPVWDELFTLAWWCKEREFEVRSWDLSRRVGRKP